MAAASSYYLLVTIAPLVLVMTWLTEAVVGVATSLPIGILSDPEVPEVAASSGQLAGVAERYFENVGQNGTLIAIGIALFGATVFVTAFIKSLDTIFHTDEEPATGWRVQLRRRGMALVTLLVVVAASLLMTVVSSVFNELLSAAEEIFASGAEPPALLSHVLDIAFWVSAVALFLMVSYAFAFLPQRRIRWRDSIVGSLLTAGAFMAGQQVLSIYLNNSSLVSAFGGTSAFLAFVVWAYYTMQVVLTGAEFTRVWADDAEARRRERARSGAG
jgi:membrane protein